MQKKKVYQIDSKNRTRVWSIEVIDNGISAEIKTESGLIDGKQKQDSVTIREGKNLGQANATTYYTQAVSEAQAKLELKLREGYVEDITQIKSSTILGSGIPAPMLAHKYDPTKKQSGSKTLKEIGVEGKTIFVQRKKDGNRDLMHVTLNGVTMYTRKGDKVPMNGMEHLSDSVLESFKKIYKFVNEKYGITEYWLDGEFFTKAFSFNKLNGLVKKEKKTAEDLALCKKIKYHLYDVILPAGYETRYKVIQYFKSPTVWVEDAYEVIATDEIVKEWLEKFLAEGEEGLMIRVPGLPYEHKRSWSLIKVKNFEDAEFEIAGAEESVKGGMVGAFICKMDRSAKDKAGNEIKTFNAGLVFSHEEATEMWENLKDYVGQKATVEFFGRSEYGVPRFPKVRGFKNDI